VDGAVRNDFVIDSEFRSLIPPLTKQEYEYLELNLDSDGCRDALVVWNGILLDGHNRLEICKRLGIAYQVNEIGLPDRDAAKIWIINNQFGRRNLQPFQRAELVLKIEPLIAAKAKENQKQSLGAGQKGLQKSADLSPVDTREELAKLSGLSHDTIHKAKVIAEKASDPIKEKLRRGETTIHREYEKIKLQTRDDEKKAELQSTVDIISPGLIVGDFREKSSEIADDVVELIFIDPPYDRESVGLYEDSARVAARILKPGGSLIAYCGHYLLPEILPLMQKHLRYWWLNACVHSGPEARMNAYGVVVGWKPMVWFTKGARGDRQTFVSDTVSGGQEKSHHEWQQSEAEAAYYVEKLTSTNGLVVDFFAGGGTTCVAAKKLGRPWIAFEINPATAKKAENRILST
jgi:hypothetical protein